MEEHSRQELLEEYSQAAELEHRNQKEMYGLKLIVRNSWKKYYFILELLGLLCPKGKENSPRICVPYNLMWNQVYYGVGWKGKYKAPLSFALVYKTSQIQAKNPKYIKYLCVDYIKGTSSPLGVRDQNCQEWAKFVRQLPGNCRRNYACRYQTLTSKRFSVNSTNGLKILTNPYRKISRGMKFQVQVLTPSSENKSLASALSSRIESDMSNVNSSKSRTSEEEPSHYK